MTTLKKDYFKLFDEMHPYMFSAENISRISGVNETNVICKEEKHTRVLKTGTQDKREDIFYPNQHDSLFWCFYIILNGIDNYELNKKKAFKTEKDFKISSIELVRKQADKIKAMKLKVSEIESGIVNDPKININILRTLALIYEVSIFYVSEPLYYDFQNSDTTKGVIVFDKFRKRVGVRHEYNDGYINNIRDSCWYVANPNKPINAVSSYTLQELRNICKKIGNDIINENGKQLTKKQLYESILTKL